MKQSSKRLVSSLLGLIAIICAFVIYFQLVQPAYTNVYNLRGRVAALSQAVDEQKLVVEKVKSLLEKMKTSDAELKLIQIALPNTSEEAQGLIQLDTLANINHLNSANYKIGIKPGVPKEAVSASSTGPLVMPRGTVTYQMHLEGSYEDLQQFLEDVETNIRLFDVTSITVSATELGVKENLFAYDVEATAYYQTDLSKLLK